jgi:hypothetical protein
VFTYLLPYVEQDSLYQTWNFDRPRLIVWDNNNQPTPETRSAQLVKTYLCPSTRAWKNPRARSCNPSVRRRILAGCLPGSDPRGDEAAAESVANRSKPERRGTNVKFTFR